MKVAYNIMQSNWFLTPEYRPSAKIRLICFSYAGGSASTYIPWGRHIDEQIELLAIQLPGRASRINEAPINDMETLVSLLYQQILSVLDKPFIFYGHSMGGKVCYELIRTLKLNGQLLPIHFFASGSLPPHIRTKIPDVANMSDREVLDVLKEFEGTPLSILENEDLIKLCLPQIRADFELVYNYHPVKQEQFEEVGVSLLGGRQDIGVCEEKLQSWNRYFPNSDDIMMFESGHFFIDNVNSEVAKFVNDKILTLI